LSILEEEASRNKLDPDVVRIFIDDELYKDVDFIPKGSEAIDGTDSNSVLNTNTTMNTNTDNVDDK